MDKITQEIINNIISANKIGCMGQIKIPNQNLTVNIPSNVSSIQLNRIRRTFLTFSKTQNISSLDMIPKLFIQYLNSNFSNE